MTDLSNGVQSPNGVQGLIGGLRADVEACSCGPDEIFISFKEDENMVFVTCVDTHRSSDAIATITVENLRELAALCISMLEMIEGAKPKDLN